MRIEDPVQREGFCLTGALIKFVCLNKFHYPVLNVSLVGDNGRGISDHHLKPKPNPNPTVTDKASLTAPNIRLPYLSRSFFLPPFFAFTLVGNVSTIGRKSLDNLYFVTKLGAAEIRGRQYNGIKMMSLLAKKVFRFFFIIPTQ